MAAVAPAPAGVPVSFEDGLSLSAIGAQAKNMAPSLMAAYINEAHSTQVKQTSSQLGVNRPYFIKEDMPGFIEYSNHLYVGLMPNEVHWINREVLPVKLTSAINFVTKKTVFEPAIPTLTPQFGVSILARSHEVEERSHSEIFSLALTVEGEIYKTPEAGEAIYMQMMQILGGNMAMLASMAYARLSECEVLQYRDMPPGRSLSSIKARMEMLINFFAMPYKFQNGISKLIQEHRRMLREGPSAVDPTHLIMYPGMMRLATTGSAEYTSFDKAGPDGVARRDGDGVILQMNGVLIREVPLGFSEDIAGKRGVSYNTYTADHHQLMMYPDSITDRVSGLPYIRLYDITQDAMVDVMFSDAFENCVRFEREPLEFADGTPIPGAEYSPDPSTWLWRVLENPGENFDAGEFRETVKQDDDPFLQLSTVAPYVPVRRIHWSLSRDYNKDIKLDEVDEDKIASDVSALIPVTDAASQERYEDAYKDELAAERAKLATQNFKKRRPTIGRTMKEWSQLVKFLIIRPFRGTVMRSGVFVAGGEGLGRTMYDPQPITHGNDNTNNSHSFRNQFRAVVHIEDKWRVSVVQNMGYAGVLTGGNCKFVDLDRAIHLASPEVNFVNEEDSDASLYSICVPINSFKTTETIGGKPMCTYTGEKIICIKGVAVQQKGRIAGDYPGYRYYSMVYGWKKIHLDPSSGSSEMPIAPMSCRGYSTYPTMGGQVEITSVGHHGMYEGPGTLNVRQYGVDAYPRLM